MSYMYVFSSTNKISSNEIYEKNMLIIKRVHRIICKAVGCVLYRGTRCFPTRWYCWVELQLSPAPSSRRLVKIVRGGRISRLKSINWGKASHARHTFCGVFNKGGVLFYWLRKQNFAVTLCRLCTYMQRGIQNIGCSNFSFMCQCQGFIRWYRFMHSGIRKYIGYIKKQSKSANVISGVSCLF